MGERKDSVTQMTELNQKILDQNTQLRNIARIATETNAIQVGTLGALDRQG